VRDAMRDGLTLIEVVVAMAVSAVILVVAGLSLDEVASHEMRSRTDASEARRVERLRRALGDELKGLLPVEGSGAFSVVEGSVDGMQADGMEFVTMAGLLKLGGDEERLGRAPRPRRVAYGCRREGETLTLFRLEGDPGTVRAVAVPVLRGLSGLSVEPVHEEDKRMTANVERVAPGLLRVEVTFAGGGRHAFVCGPHATHRLRSDGGFGE